MVRAALRAVWAGWVTPLACAVLLVVAAAATAEAQSLPNAGSELLMFEEAGCPWCRRWDAEISPAYPKSDEGRTAPLRRIQISDWRRSGYRLASPVTVTPTFVLIHQGAEVGRITGYPGADFFWGMLDELIAKLPARPAPERPRDARAAPAYPVTVISAAIRF